MYIGGPSPGTGYLIANNRIATCWHVVKVWDDDDRNEVKIGFPDSDNREAYVIKADKETDCAVLGFKPPVDKQPLPLADRLKTITPWEGFGYPAAAGGTGLPIRGEVTDPDSRDQSHREVMALFSKQVAAGQATPLHGFSGTPVLVDGAVVGHIIRHVGDPDDNRRPAWGLIFATHISGVRDLLDIEPLERSINPPDLAEPIEFLDSVKTCSIDEAKEATDEDSVLIVVETLIGTNHPERALEILKKSGRTDLRTLQLRALALAKSGNIPEARDLLRQLVGQGENDPETLGILGGRYKDLWKKSQETDRGSLQASYDIYKRSYEATDNAYVGINLAATALYLGNRAEAAVVSSKLLNALNSSNFKDHWDRATYAEAFLLSEKYEDARRWYSKAVAHSPEKYQDIAVMRRQARLNLKYLGRDRHEFDDVLQVPGVVAFAGHMVDTPGRDPARFPEEKVPEVRAAIRSKLSELGFTHGFGTAAAGSDILFLQVFVERSVRPVVIMPFPEPDFRLISVGEGYWGRELDKLHGKLDIRILKGETPSKEDLNKAFFESNAEIQRLATDYAERLDEKVKLIVVWDGKNEADGPGGTKDVVHQWRLAEVEPIIIDITTL